MMSELESPLEIPNLHRDFQNFPVLFEDYENNMNSHQENH